MMKNNFNNDMTAAKRAETHMDIALERKKEAAQSLLKKKAFGRFLLFMAAALAVVTVLMQSVLIYSTQKRLTDLDQNIAILKRDGESLRVQQINAEKLTNAQKTVEGKGLIDRSSVEPLTVDLNFDNFR